LRLSQYSISIGIGIDPFKKLDPNTDPDTDPELFRVSEDVFN
jgi:hypothetical protein